MSPPVDLDEDDDGDDEEYDESDDYAGDGDDQRHLLRSVINFSHLSFKITQRNLENIIIITIIISFTITSMVI